MKKLVLSLFCAFFVVFAAESNNAESRVESNTESSTKSRAQSRAQANPALISEIKTIVQNRFLEFYKPYNINIESLEVAPATTLKLDKMKLDKVIFNDIKRESGNFEVHLYHKQKRQRVFFTFNISATIEAMSAKSNIKSGEIVSSANTDIVKIPISRNMQLPANSEILEQYAAKGFISAGSIIMQNKIAPRVVISKGENIQVSHSVDGFSITFNAKALEDGAKGATIKAQNAQSGKNIEILILDKERAILK